MKLLLANQSTAAKRRVFFFCVAAADGLTPVTGENGGQPQISTDGGGWTDTGIGVLVELSLGYYYAELTQSAVNTTGRVICTRYKSANTAETLGTTVQVVAFDPDAITNLGLTNLDTTVSSRAAATTALDNTVWTDTKAGYIDQAISGTAPASTALSNATWTNTKAGYLDVAVSSAVAPTAGAVADAVWDEAAAGHVAAGSMGILMSGAEPYADPGLNTLTNPDIARPRLSTNKTAAITGASAVGVITIASTTGYYAGTKGWVSKGGQPGVNIVISQVVDGTTLQCRLDLPYISGGSDLSLYNAGTLTVPSQIVPRV